MYRETFASRIDRQTHTRSFETAPSLIVHKHCIHARFAACESRFSGAPIKPMKNVEASIDAIETRAVEESMAERGRRLTVTAAPTRSARRLGPVPAPRPRGRRAA
ncbi:hypothetical protein EVAR_77174_1 [Eumeta japonica]|uniref:Uncharacterized protein n=1 Tax=Eumeta variegata TaxID=151549 RepID=A0A4C1T4V9_EUMVA|nr:hypothetical protein EVAR_77174_1 [Eumeta japonica]